MNANIIEKLDIEVVNGPRTDIRTEIGGQLINVNYGDLLYGSDSTFFINIKPKGDEKIEKINVRVSCGCTSTNTIQEEGKIRIKFVYDTTRKGVINKSATIMFEMNNITEKIFLKLTGNIKKYEL